MIGFVITLALVQGITEFLPISSSGHLVLLHGLSDQHLSDHQEKIMDIAVHIGTLLAVLLYFRRDFFALVKGGLHLIAFQKSAESRKAFLIITASIPVILCGLVVFMIDISVFDSLQLMAWMSIVFGIVLYVADRKPEGPQTTDDYTFKDAMIYGLAQCIALIPGVSRSGITMTAGRFLGHSRVEAAKFSLLLGMVTIAAAGTLTGLSLFEDTTINNEFLMVLGLGIFVSFATAYAAILLMMRWLKSASFTPFVVYRVLLGIVLLGLLYSGMIPQDM